MILSLDKIRELINAPVDKRIEAARIMSKKLMLHVEGVGLQEYLSQINNYENAMQFKAREKHAISNKFIAEELLRPTDNAFNARGGSTNYKFNIDSETKEKELVSKLAKIKNSHSLSWYIENEWFNKFITDPNGLILIESDGENTPEPDRNAYPTYKSIHSIKTYEQNGMYVDYVVFEPHENKEYTKNSFFGGKGKTEVKFYWIIDDKNWYLVKKENDNISIERTLPHGFKRVPAILCSDIIDNVTGWKKSPIDAQVELLDKFLVSNSVVNIVEFFHNYPRPYLFADKCTRCNGTGNIGTASWVSCDNPGCQNGSLVRRDVTDTILIKIPEEGEPIIKDPGGYLFMPTEPLQLMYTSIDRTWNRIFFSHWGTVVSKDTGKDYSTATGRYIDAQPVNNRLNKYSKSIEKAHTAIADFFGEYYFPLTFTQAFIQYGRRYLIETPDQIWEKYVNAKKLDAPVSSLDILLFQYIESEYRENDTMGLIETKKAKLEPFVHWSIKTVRDSQTISDEDKQMKEFFGEWVHSKDVEELYSKDLESLRKDLITYTKSKTLNIVQGIPDEKVTPNNVNNGTAQVQ
jgi:hypothetical protein